MESLGGELQFMTPRPFEGEQMDAIRAISAEHRYAAGEYIMRVGEPMDRFVLIAAGRVEVVDAFPEEPVEDAVMNPGQFMGKLAFLNAGKDTLPLRAATDVTTLEAPREAMLELMSRVPEIGDHALTVFAARRRSLFEEGESAIKLIGAEIDPAIQRVAIFLSRNRVPFQSDALDEQGEEALAACSIAAHRPAVVIGKGRRRGLCRLGGSQGAGDRE